MIAIGFDCTLSSSYAGCELGVDLARALEVAGEPGRDLLGDLRADHVGVDADAARPAELEERLDEVVVAGVERQARLDDVPRLRQVGVRLLHGRDRLDLGEPGDRLGLDVHHDACRDVVDDDRPVARAGDLLEVRDDPALRRLGVVRRDDEERVGAELVRPLGEVDGVRRRVGAGARDDRGRVADRLDRRADELEPLLVGQRRALAGRAGDDDSVRAVLDEVAREFLERVEVDRPVLAERRHDRRQDVSEHARREGYSAAVASFVLVHGAWHGAWCFAELAGELEARGHSADAVDLPCDEVGLTQLDYAALVGPRPDAILVGHSLGGQTIPHVEARLRVYLAACCRSRLRRPTASRPASAARSGTSSVARTGPTPDTCAARMYPDCTRAQSDWAFAQLRRQAPIAFAPAPFGSGDVVIATLRDAAIDPGWQVRTATTRGARVLELDAGHSPFFTQPAALAELLSGY